MLRRRTENELIEEIEDIMSQDESSLGRKIDKKTLGDDSDEDESDDSSQSLNTQPRRRNPDQASVGILPLKEGTKKSKDNARHYHSKSESENGIESHLEDSKVARRAKGDLTKKSNLKGETNMRETDDIMSEDESSLGRKVGKKTLDDSNEDESDDFSQSLNTKPRRRNPDQYSIGILPLKEGTKKFKDDARHYHSESESENGIESHLEDSKVTRKAKGDLRKKSLLKGETKMTDDLSDDEEHHDFKKETKLSSLEDDGHRNYESCPKPAKTPRHHDEEGKKRGLNLELQERKITAPSSNQQTNNNVQVSDESGSDFSENNLRVRSHVQKKSDVVKKGNSNMLHQHVGSESDSDNLSGRILERQVEERALKKGSFKRSTKKNSHNKGGSDSESEQYCESEEKNKLSKKDTRDCRKMNQERYTSKKNSHNESESESDSESEQHYKSNGRKELSRKDTRDYGKMKEENNTSKRNLKKMSKYEEQNKSDSSEDKWTEKRPHSKISPKAKETHYSEVKTLSHLSDRSQSGRGREAKNHSSSRKVNAQSCSESDSDSDNYCVKEAKDPREARHGSAEKSMRKGISKEKKEYRKHEHESQSELSDGSYTDKEYSKGESYMGYGSRRGKNRSSHNDIESDPNEEQQGFHTPRAKSKHQQKGDVSKPYGRNFQEKMESIDRNLPRRQKSDAYSSLAEKERDAEDFTSKHSREKYRERNGGKSTYQQTGSESETEDQSFRNTSRGRVERPYKEDGEWTNSDSFKHKKRAHGKYKDPNSENQHLKNMNEGKREDTGQNVDYENDGAGYSPQRNFQRREDRYEERWSQEYHHKHGRGKEPKGKAAVPGAWDVYQMQTTEQYSDEDTVYQTRRPFADATDYGNPKGLYRKPRHGHVYHSQNLHEPSNGSDYSESNTEHGIGWSRRKMSAAQDNYNAGEEFDKPVFHVKKKSRELSVITLISIMLKHKKCQAPINLLMKLGLKPREVWPVVHGNPHLFNVKGSDEIICLRLQIKVCSGHLNNGCTNKSSCCSLHICPRHLQGICRNVNCALGHKITSRHNAMVLDDFNFNDIPEQDILRVLSLSVPNLYASHHLKICNDYNGKKCQRTNCSDLHICQDYLITFKCDTKYCPLDHSFQTKTNTQILESHGIDTNESPRDIIKSIKDKYPSIFRQHARSGDFSKQAGRQQFERRNVQQTRRVQSQSSDNVTGYINPGSESVRTPSNFSNPENLQIGGTAEHCHTVWCDEYQGNVAIPQICYYSVSSRCRYEEGGCKRLHADRYFHWQVKQRGKGWINLRPHQVEVLERSYCDPAQDGVVVPPVDHTNCPKGMLTLFGKDSWQGHFPSMILRNGKTQMSLDLRRICSENVDGNVKCAQYLWYFLDQNNVWVQYGNIDTTNRGFLVSNITSEDIEKEYQRNLGSSMTFKNSMFTYLLDFQSMTQTNTSTNVTRKVRRRPVPHLKGKSKWSFNIFNRP